MLTLFCRRASFRKVFDIPFSTVMIHFVRSVNSLPSIHAKSHSLYSSWLLLIGFYPFIDPLVCILSVSYFLGNFQDRESLIVIFVAVYRRWSNRVSLAYRTSSVVAVLWFPFLIHRLLLYSSTVGKCVPKKGAYQKYDTYYELAFSAIVPPTLLVTIGCLLLRNVRIVARKRTAPDGIMHRNRPFIHQIENQLTRMILLQCFVAVFSFSLFGAQNLYSNITQHWNKSVLRGAWEKTIGEFIRLCGYLFHSTTFYISLISSSGFRKQALYSFGIERELKCTDPLPKQSQTFKTAFKRDKF